MVSDENKFAFQLQSRRSSSSRLGHVTNASLSCPPPGSACVSRPPPLTTRSPTSARTTSPPLTPSMPCCPSSPAASRTTTTLSVLNQSAYTRRRTSHQTSQLQRSTMPHGSTLIHPARPSDSAPLRTQCPASRDHLSLVGARIHPTSHQLPPCERPKRK